MAAAKERVQGKIVDAQQVLDKLDFGAYVAMGAAVAFFLSIPWCWYFLLRRLAEVSAAIRGKGP
jgi:hypothetical protein